ncbi:MAG TPA: hypothetical protein PKB06_09320 [Actinotalea sp.]|nr:hypothetical protein [Actinotalea sp.]
MSETSGSERAYLPLSAPPRNHGNTPAAWVTVTVIMAGGLLSVLGVIFVLPVLFWSGLAVIALGLVAGRVMRMLGLGQPVVPTSTRSVDPGQAVEPD